MENTPATPVISYDYAPEAVVVGGGVFPSHHIPRRIHDTASRVVCCDGAANEYIKQGLTPWRIVGDCDSIAVDILDSYGDIVRRNPCQESNDQTKAIDYLLRRGIKRIAIIAATGRREDHTIGNIFLLQHYYDRGLDVRMYTDCGVFVPCKGDMRFSCPIGTAVSVFALGTHGMRSEGLMYSLYDFNALWQGTLNCSTASTFSISCPDFYTVFLNYPHE